MLVLGKTSPGERIEPAAPVWSISCTSATTGAVSSGWLGGVKSRGDGSGLSAIPADGHRGVHVHGYRGLDGAAQRLGDGYYSEVLEQHRSVLRSEFVRCEGVEMGTEGDSFFIAFGRAPDAVDAAVALQRGLAAANWPNGARVRVRVGVHTGQPTLVADGYVGLDVHRAARIMAAANGGQVVMSQATRDLVLNGLPDGAEMRTSASIGSKT